MTSGGSARARAAWPVSWLAVFLLALGWRLWFVARLAHSPYWGVLDADAKIYWEWAGLLLRRGWTGHNPFFLGPLYPYVLAALRELPGTGIGPALVVQAIWGAAAVALLADTARRLTRPWIGVTIGVLLAGYSMAIVFDGLILSESLLFFLESVLLWAVVRIDWSTARSPALVGLGLLIGALAQGRATAALLLIPVAILLRSTRAAGSARSLALVGAVFLATVVPGAVHNRVQSGDLVPFTYNLGYNLRVGFNPEASGSFVVITGTMAPFQLETVEDFDGGAGGDGRAYLRSTKGLELSAGESSRYWSGQAWEFVRASPARAAKLTAQHALMFWNWREYPQIESPSALTAGVGVSGWPVLGTFAFLALLAFAGWGAAWRHGPAGRFVAGYAWIQTAAVLPFFVTDRYRLHLVPAAALLAALGIANVVRAASERRSRALLRAAGALAAGALCVALPMPGQTSSFAAWDRASDLGSIWLARGRPDLAVIELEKAVRIDQAGQLPRSRTATALQARAAVFTDCATALRQLDRIEEALHWYEEAFRTSAARPESLALAMAYAMSGRKQSAEPLFAGMGMTPGAAAARLMEEAVGAYRAGRTPEVERLLRAAIDFDPTLEAASIALVRLQIQTGRLDEAENTLQEARVAGLAPPRYYAHEALIRASRGDRDGAEQALGRVSKQAQQSDPTLTEVLASVRARLASPARTSSGHR
jgi:tetratricopeptide (TPR) repeat protein